MSGLPAPTPQAEDAYVSFFANESEEALVQAIQASMRAGRPALAGRLVGMLASESEDPDVLKARRAARMLCLSAPTHWEEELQDLLERVRERHLQRATSRSRRRLKHPGRVGIHPKDRARSRIQRGDAGSAPPDKSSTDYAVMAMPSPRERLHALGRALILPFARRWSAMDERQRRHAYALGLMGMLALANFLVYTTWFVEDAGISMAYARNAAAGEGWVTYAGGERVEGFSNPLWTFLMGLGYLVGINGFVSSKLMGAVFGLACLPLSYALAQEARFERSTRSGGDNFPLLAPLLVCLSTTVAVWHGSGLENSLFNVLLLTGMWRTLVEGRDGEHRFPLSALAFVGLAATRPEGIAYGAVGGFFSLVLALRNGKGWVRKVGLWLGVFFVPYGLFQTWRVSYFAWPFPNTYYAKVDGENRFQPWRWTSRGWDYLRNYLRAYHLGMFAPLIGLGLVTLKDWRKWVFTFGALLAGILIVWDGRAGLPDDFDPEWLNWLQRHWDRTRITTVLVVAASTLLLSSKEAFQTRLGVCLMGLGALLLGAYGLPETVPDSLVTGLSYGGAAVMVLSLMVHLDRGGAARGLMGSICAVGGFFVLYSGGDWMAQWRFVSYIIIPLLTLVAVGLAELLESLPFGHTKVVRWALGVPLVLLFAAPNLWQALHAGGQPVTSVNDVHQRVRYMQTVQDRMHIDRVSLFDVDMGAHMYFSDWRIVDVAGLVDVSMGHHIYQKDFIVEYVFEEKKPTFAHQHANWARKTKVGSLPIWDQDYIEVPGYPTGKLALHIGNHVRREKIMRPEYEGPPDRWVSMEGDLEFEGWHVPSPEVPQGGKLFIEYWLKAELRERDVQVFAVLESPEGQRHIAAVPAAYGYLPIKQWRQDEHARTRIDFDLPKDLPLGRYALGFWILDAETGEVLKPSEKLPRNAYPGELEGSVLWPNVVHIVNAAEAEGQAVNDFGSALEWAKAGDCDASWGSWRQARYHVWHDQDWRDDREDEMNDALAGCWVQLAQEADSRQDVVAAIYEARWFDHQHPDVLDFAEPYAQKLVAQGNDALNAGDLDAAYEAYRDALVLDPSLSWTRKKAEEVRDARLKISAKDKSYRPAKAPKVVRPEQPPSTLKLNPTPTELPTGEPQRVTPEKELPDPSALLRRPPLVVDEEVELPD